MTNKAPYMRLVVNREASPPQLKGLYLITDQGERLIERVGAALTAGVSFLQYRNKELDPAKRLAEGLELKRLCASFGTSFIVNDDLALAKALDADGLHLGQDDGSLAEARRTLGHGKIIGVSTHTLAEALQAEADGADYIGFGAMYQSNSKAVEHLPGAEGLAAIRARVRLPIVAIGGISRDNACRVIDAGADAIAVISAVLGSPDPAMAVAELQLLFNRTRPFPRGAVLTIAGSDSGGGAGIQGDLKTITLLGSYGASAITALTAQNTRGVAAIYGIPSSFVAEQLEAVLADLPVDVIKTGMLFSAATIAAIVEKLAENGRRLLVVDPVMVAKGGAHLMESDAVSTFREQLIPLCYLLTPNIPEAEQLTGLAIVNEYGMEQAARALKDMGAKHVLVKGGHLPAGEAVDILFDGAAFHRYPAQRIFTTATHGTGCTFASAIATCLAQGEPLPLAVAKAKEFITTAIKRAIPMGKGHGPVNHFLAAKETGIGD